MVDAVAFNEVSQAERQKKLYIRQCQVNEKLFLDGWRTQIRTTRTGEHLFWVSSFREDLKTPDVRVFNTINSNINIWDWHSENRDRLHLERN